MFSNPYKPRNHFLLSPVQKSQRIRVIKTKIRNIVKKIKEKDASNIDLEVENVEEDLEDLNLRVTFKETFEDCRDFFRPLHKHQLEQGVYENYGGYLEAKHLTKTHNMSLFGTLLLKLMIDSSMHQPHKIASFNNIHCCSTFNPNLKKMIIMTSPSLNS